MQWGINGFATRLWIENTASTGGSNVTGETFSDAIGTVFGGVAGTTACQAASTQVACTASIPPGETFFVDMLSPNGNPPVGTTGTATLIVNGAPVQVTVMLQTSTITSSSGTTETTPPPPRCEAKLHITKKIEVQFLGIDRKENDFLKHEPGPNGGTYVTHELPTEKPPVVLSYTITVTNTSECEAKDVSITDAMPLNFHCGHVFVHGRNSGCTGHIPQELIENIGNLAPGQTADATIYGRFIFNAIDEGKAFKNTAHANAKNALGTNSKPPVAVKVVSEEQFKKTS